jgi:F-type H+-transporting ATPase subunit b
MEALIRPEFGLMFWTIFIFILLVLILSKTAWKPLMKAVEERERSIRHDRESAEKARAEAEKIKADLDLRIAEFKTEMDRRLQEAVAEGERERLLILEDARKSAVLLAESAKRELEAQKNDLEKELKGRVAEIAFMAAEKVLLKTIDQKANKELVGHFLKELEGKDARYKLGN